MSHHKAELYNRHPRISPGIFCLRPDTGTVSGHGYPTAVTITMDTLRPSYNYCCDRPPPREQVQIGLAAPICVGEWEYSLFNRTCLMKPSEQIHHTLRMTATLITCSDGSVRSSSGSFGFIISDHLGIRLLKGYGPAPGNPPTSFRSEAYGVLATVRWLYHAFQSSALHPQATITHYIDNTSVIHRITSTLKTTWYAPNHRMLPEQDVIDEIVTTMRQLPIKVDLQWVKGHQDSTHPYSLLPLPAQLNCDADKAAEQWHRQTDVPPCSTIPHMPATPSQIYLHGQPITSNVKRRAYAAATLLPLHQYLKTKFQWSDDTDQCIDWLMYRQIITKGPFLWRQENT